MTFGFVRIVGELAANAVLSAPSVSKNEGAAQAKRGFSLERTPALLVGVIKVLDRPMECPNLPRFLGEVSLD